MKCAVVGKRYVWIFFAPDKRKGRKIANTILLLESLGTGNEISGFDHAFGYWKAVGQKPEEAKNLRLKEGGKVIEIKRKRPSKIDCIYMTRQQKERV